MNDDMMRRLAREALAMRQYSYVPYSHFAVGAALLTEDGTVYTGCNIENRSYSATNCAERTAIFKAVSEGRRSFKAIAVCGGPEGSAPSDYCAPCAVCLQVLSEFAGPDLDVYLVRSEDDIRPMKFGELLPVRFDNI